MHAFLSGAVFRAAAFLTILFPLTAQAGVIQVRPTMLLINPAQHVAVLSLENPDAAATTYQVSIYKWRQDGDEQALDPTTDMIASPPIISLPGYGSQIVRVGMRNGGMPADERAYRLILEEIPSPDAMKKPGLNIALRLSLPLFVRSVILTPSPKLTADVKVADREAIVTLHNQGAYTARATKAVLNAKASGDADGAVTDKLTYILPGGSAHYNFALPTALTTMPNASLSLQTEDGVVDLPLPMVSEAVPDAPQTTQP